MTQQEAVRWLQEVGGNLFRTPPKAGRQAAWVAVVPMPRSGPMRSAARPRLIVALGGSMEEATGAAEEQWRGACESPAGAH